MNHSPWYVDHTANYERQRIQDDMRQIRLEQKAMKARVRVEERAGSRPTVLRTFKHATLVVTHAILALFA